jgi:hypothetical protein
VREKEEVKQKCMKTTDVLLTGPREARSVEDKKSRAAQISGLHFSPWHYSLGFP